MLLGFVPPTSGTAYLFGIDVRQPIARQRIGYLPEMTYYYKFLTAEELLRFYARIFGLPPAEADKRIDRLLKLVELEPARKRLIKTYSKGMQQRVGLAQALINNPDLLILDEPTSGLDPLGRMKVREIIQRLKNEGKTVFFSSHELGEVETVCDRVAIINQGELKTLGRVERLVAQHQRQSGKGFSGHHRLSTANRVMNTIWALAGVVIKELYRRKDFYVLFVLTAVITVCGGQRQFFHDPNIVRYVKDLCMLLIWISALLITIVTAARQIPAERENRTIFPLLAKPVTRGQVILGKFFGCWLACGTALAVFYVFFAVITGSREQYWPVLDYFQAFLLQWIMLGIVTAMTLLGSLVFAAPSSTVTILFIVVAGILFLGRHLNTVALHNPEPMRSIIYTIYFIIPHLELFDVRERVVNDWGLVNWLDCGLATLYAAAYTGLFLLLTWLAFPPKKFDLMKRISPWLVAGLVVGVVFHAGDAVRAARSMVECVPRARRLE